MQYISEILPFIVTLFITKAHHKKILKTMTSYIDDFLDVDDQFYRFFANSQATLPNTEQS